MLQLVYCSIATRRPSTPELEALLTRSRDANLRHGITGMLVYEDGVYLQVIEGPTEGIMRLKANIEADPRHHSFRQLHYADIAAREFGDWAMAFAAPGTNLATVEGFIDITQETMGGGLSTSKARQMLGMFHDGTFRPSPPPPPSDSTVSVTFAPANRSTNARLDANTGRTYLTQLAHAIALSLPDVGVCVEIAPGDLISYNVHRDLMKGEAELF